MVCVITTIIVTEDDTHVDSRGRNDIQPVCYLPSRAKSALTHSSVLSATVFIESIFLYLQSVSRR